MTQTVEGAGRVSDHPENRAFSVTQIAKWMIGLRLVAVSALLVGALLVQVTTEELLPIANLARVAGLTYVLSLLWIALWFLRIPPGLMGALQLVGDLVIVTTIIYLTGAAGSPFPFLYFITVAIAALMFGLRGALTVGGGAFICYAAVAEAIHFHLVRSPSAAPLVHAVGPSQLALQLFVTGTGLSLVAVLTSYLARSLQLAEASLRDQRQATARLMALSADVLRSVDSGVIAADLNGVVVLSNPGARRILGQNDELEGRSITDLLPLADMEWQAVLHNVASGTAQRLEAMAAETSAPLGCTLTPLRAEDGTPVGLVAHFRDLTEVREAARRELLRERLAAVGEMAAGLAHEIRNPLASISGSAQVLAKGAEVRDSDRRLLRIIVDESRRLSGILESFLGYTRPPEQDRQPCDVAAVIEETLTLFRNSPEVGPQHHIAADVKRHARTILADEKQLRQAFFNLARNAIQAMEDGGTMRVQAAPEGDFYSIAWSDQGVGMNPRQVEGISEPFKAFRTGGIGLGLSVVYSIVSEHGGDVNVESAVGRGTTFTIRLPMEPV